VSQLGRAGFPPELLQLLSASPESTSSLEAVFSLLPPPPVLPKSAGTLIAVIAPKDEVIATAARVARELRLDDKHLAYLAKDPVTLPTATRRTTKAKHVISVTTPTGTVTLTEGFVAHDIKLAATLADGWRRDRVVIVAVALPDSIKDYRWVRNVLRAIRPTTTWGLIDARSKRTDVEHLAESIGGLDALMLEHLRDTYSPAELLQAGIPITRLNGRRATPSAWARAVRAVPKPAVTVEISQ
jgi:hypothetical protein